eukprot:CAMPEP_0175934582 /NCGR_PEP_ID=MMETSP0108-20121206/20572_1 /TAXON_ID=195067 ORGANISM="Goniomonas pacifica, Strain CCMP1869" /NCGR_SAMPLE_ID=MMETSP0108 /ASSEMBLY_ACC=CAM_ASM_000204 /LENGTH=171 /DNA_ID=CAMNT_0017258441 /DNA_START=323 /DNA_END=838 /DNA_ORIENTATION=-
MVVEMEHPVPCVGYVFSERRQMLKEEYRGLPGPEIGQLRKAGTQVTEEVDRPLFAFLGDTSARGVTAIWSDLQGVPVVFVECTSIDAGEEDSAEQRGHVHWRTLLPLVKAEKDTTFVLIHFSLKFSDTQLQDYFRQEAAENGLTNVVLWLDSGVIRAHGQDGAPAEAASGP